MKTNSRNRKLNCFLD